MRIPALIVRNLKRRPWATGLTAFSVALGVALFSAVGALREAGEAGFQRSAGICDLVVGAKGSPLELTLNSIYQMGQSPGNIPFQAWEEIQATPGVNWSIPLAVGDGYRGFRVVGVTDTLFTELEISKSGPLRFTQGGPFAYGLQQVLWDRSHFVDSPGSHAGHDHGAIPAVCGARAAAGAGLKVGSIFHPAHDVSAAGADVHEEEDIQVVGVLAPTGTPLDRAIFIPLGAYWGIEGHQATKETSAGGARDPRGISAILVRSKPGYYHIRLWRDWNDRLETQAAQPAVEIRRLFEFVGMADQALRFVSALVVLVALVGALVAITNTMTARRHEFAILRALGARRRTLFMLIVGESASVAFLGGFLGLLMAQLGIRLGAERLLLETGVLVSSQVGSSELVVLLVVTSVGAIAGWIPANSAYRTEASRFLSSSL